MKYRYSQVISVAVLLNLVLAIPARAVEIEWVGGDGAWEDGDNWSLGTPPSAEDFTTILHTGAISSSALGNTAEELHTHSILSVGSGSLHVVGTLDTTGEVSTSGGAALDLGRVIVEAAGAFSASDLGTTVDVVEGIFSSGQFTASNAAAISAESLDNLSSMTIASGATVTANSMINHEGAALGVADAGSRLAINGALTNDGAVEVSNDGLLETDSIDNTATIEIGSGGEAHIDSMVNEATVTVTGAGSHLAASATITNHAALTIDGGATAATSDVVNHGTITIADAVVNGNAIDNREGATVALGAEAAVELEASVLNRGTVNVAETAALMTAAYQQLQGATVLAGGTLGATSAFGIAIAGGSLSGHGLLEGTVLTQIGGTLSPGTATDPTGSFAITGDALLGGILSIDLATLDDYDVIDATGSAVLGGTLQLSVSDAFAPELGDVFDLLFASSIVGDFDTLLLPALAGGLTFEAVIGADFYRLAVVTVPLPAALWLMGPPLLAMGATVRRRARAGVAGPPPA